MIILSLDCATKTGWALIKDGRVFESGVQDFTKRRGDSNGMLFLRFRNWLGAMLDMGPALVAYERAHHRGGAATEIAASIGGPFSWGLFVDCGGRISNLKTLSRIIFPLQ